MIRKAAAQDLPALARLENEAFGDDEPLCRLLLETFAGWENVWLEEQDGRPVSMALIVFGGDTLLGIMQAIRCRYIIPIRELRPGIVLSRAVCEDGSLTLVTKAGGFGEVDTIPYINKCLDECTSAATGGFNYV